MSDIQIGIDSGPAEAGGKRVEAAFARIQSSAVKSIGGADRAFSSLYTSLNKFDSLKGVNSGALASIQSLSSAMDVLSRTAGPNATSINNIKNLSASLSGVKAPSAATIRNLSTFGDALRNVTSTPSASAISKIGTLSSAINGFKAPSSSAAGNLQKFFDVLNNAKFSTNVTTNLKALSTAVQGLGPFVGMANNISNAMNNMNNSSNKAGGGFKFLEGSGLSLGQALLRTHAALEGMAAVLGARQIIDAATDYQKMDLALKATLNSASAAANEMQFAQDTANKYGVSIGSLGQNYAQLLASAQGTNITVADSRRIFEGVTQAVRVYGLSTEDAEGVYRALTQMVSKGTVQMEELRGQLGDRLPGAVQIFAKGLGVTTAQLMKMSQQSQISGDTLRRGLLGFADELKARTGGALDEAATTLPAALGRIQTAFVNFSAFLIKGGFGQGLINFTNALGSLMSNTAVLAFLGGLGAAFQALSEHMVLVSTVLAVSLIPNIVKMTTVQFAMAAASAVVSGNTMATGTAMAQMARGISGALGSLNFWLIAVTAAVVVGQALADQLNSTTQMHKHLDEASKALTGTIAAESNGINDLREKYDELAASGTRAAKAREQAGLDKAVDNASKASTDAAMAVSSTYNTTNATLSGNGVQGVDAFDGMGFTQQQIDSVKNFQSVNSTAISGIEDMVTVLQKQKQAALDNGTEFDSFSQKILNQLNSVVDARQALYDYTVKMNELKGMSAETAAVQAEISTGFDDIGNAARDAGNQIGGVGAALDALSQKKANVADMAKALASGDKGAMAAIYGKLNAPPAIQKAIATQASQAGAAALASTKVNGRSFDPDTVEKSLLNPNSIGYKIYHSAQTKTEGQLYQEAAGTDDEYTKLNGRLKTQLGYGKDKKEKKPPNDPYSVDTAKEAVTQLNKYLDPEEKATKNVKDAFDAINLLAAKNPQYLEKTTGELTLQSAILKAQELVMQKITETLAKNIPELSAQVDAQQKFRTTTDSINELYKVRPDLIDAAGGKEALINQARLRMENDIYAAQTANVKSVSDEQAKAATNALNYLTAQLNATHAITAAIQEARGAAYDAGSFGVKQDLDMKSAMNNVGVGINSSGAIGSATEEGQRQLDVDTKMLALNRQLATIYGMNTSEYNRQSTAAKSILDSVTATKLKLAQSGDVDSLVSKYAHPGEATSAFQFERDNNTMRAMATKSTNNDTGINYSTLSDADAQKALDHLKEIPNAFLDAQIASTKFGQAMSDAMSKAGDSLAELLTTGKTDISSLIQSVISDVLKLAVIQPLIQTISRTLMTLWNPSAALSIFSAPVLPTLAAGTSLPSIPSISVNHTGGSVGDTSRHLRLHSGGIVPRGGVSQGDLRSWEYLTQLPKGSEVLTQYNERHSANPRNKKSSNMMDVLLKAGEEVLYPDDPRHFNNIASHHTGGVVGGGSDGGIGHRSEDSQTGGVTIHNNVNVSIPANASRGPTADGDLARKIAQEFQRSQETQLSSALAYRKRNTRNMQVG